MDTQVPRRTLSPGSPLPAEALYAVCDPARFDFETTEALHDFDPMLGQERAAEAVQFGMDIRSDGYNVFALGARETDKDRLVRHLLEERARTEAPPSDWCYVFNFEQPHQPKILQLPPGASTRLRADMATFIDELRTELTATFESEEYQTRRQVIEDDVQHEHEEALDDLRQQAEQKGIALLRTPTGFLFVPMKDGEAVSPKALTELPEETLKRAEKEIDVFQDALLHILRQVPQRKRRLREQLRALNQEVARYAVHDLIHELRAKYEGLEQVQAHLTAIEEDIVENVGDLVHRDGSGEGSLLAILRGSKEPSVLLRYFVNALVEHAEAQGAPVIYEDHPTLQNLFGSVEYQSEMGALVTNFTLIRPGVLHRANGGYLLLDARKVLHQPFVWEALKRALRAGEIRIQSPYDEIVPLRTVSLEPEPIPLRIKVVLLGDRLLYYLLHAYDPEFAELFRVEADFDDVVDRTADHEQGYARLIGALARQHSLRPVDRAAVARLVEHSARRVGDAQKLSAETGALRDLLREADYWAGRRDHEHVLRDDVEEALETRRRRSGRLRERLQEEILRDTLFIDTDGAVTGQVNGLSVVLLGRDLFGHPSRITARVRLGKGDVIDIEREVELGGPIHTKGVLILSSFLGARYAADEPLSLSASLVFEQTYGGIEGDSASAAELCALLSAIADVPLKQSLAVTGSVNQHGKIQPIGGVNEKIEGFFDLCHQRGLTGEQGVLIPTANVKHLMLRREVVEAAAQGRFHVYPVEDIDEAMERLTGMPMGTLRDDGVYPDDSVNGCIVARLRRLAAAHKAFLVATDGKGQGDGSF